MKVFISLPMHGRSDGCIMTRMEDIKNDVQRIIGPDEEIEFIDNFHKSIPEDIVNERIWCLGDSIKLMQNADFVVFANDYRRSRGCSIEFEVCATYHIPCVILGGEATDTIKRQRGVSGITRDIHKMVLEDGFLGRVSTDE